MRSDRVFIHHHTDGLQAVYDGGLDETARSRKSAGYSSSPLSPETTPVALCQQLTGFLERVQPYLRKTSESIHLELRECDMSATV